MRFYKSKNASEGNPIGDTGPFLGIFIVIVGISFAIFLVVAYFFISDEISVASEVAETIFAERIYNSPECLAFKDSVTGRVYLESVDIEKFRNFVMDKCIVMSTKYTMKLEIQDPENGETISIKTPNWIESGNYWGKQKDVNVYRNGKFSNGKLSIYLKNA